VVPGISHKVDHKGPRVSVPNNLENLYDTLTAPAPVNTTTNAPKVVPPPSSSQPQPPPPPQRGATTQAQQTPKPLSAIPTPISKAHSEMNNLTIPDSSFRGDSMSTGAVSPFLHGVVSPELASTMRSQVPLLAC
jgi:hypothetical protein